MIKNNQSPFDEWRHIMIYKEAETPNSCTCNYFDSNEIDDISQLILMQVTELRGDHGATPQLNKEAHKWATKVAKDNKVIQDKTRILQAAQANGSRKVRLYHHTCSILNDAMNTWCQDGLVVRVPASHV